MRPGERFLAAAVGLMLLAVALWSGSRYVDAADAGGSFRLERDATQPETSEDGARTWSARVQPRELAARVVVRVDGETVATGEDPQIDTAGLSTGLHLVETEIERRGGRRERIVDHLWVGPFAQRWRDDPGCGLSLTLSERALERLLLPELQRQVLPALRASAYMGPETIFEEVDLELDVNRVRFSATIQGLNRVEVEGILVLARAGDRKVDVRLLHLSRTAFTGRTRDQAVGTGAAVGAVVTGPLAPIGAVAGGYVVGKFLDRKARDIIEDQIEDGLRLAKTVELFPGRVVLLPGHPASAVELAFCEAPTSMPGAIGAKIGVRPVAPTEPRPRSGSTRYPGGAPGPVFFGTSLPELRLSGDEDVALVVTVDVLNALLDAWTAQGLLSDLLAASPLQAATNAQLTAWTTVHVEDVGLGLPPVLGVPGADAAGEGWPIAMAGIELRLGGTHDASGEAQIQLAGRGRVSPTWDEDRGRLVLAGGLDDLSLVCRESADDGGEVLRPCFAALLELSDARARLDEQLAPTTEGLPAIDLRELVESRSAGRLTVKSLELVAEPDNSVVRLSARL